MVIEDSDVAIQFDLQALDAARRLPTVERVQPSVVLLPHVCREWFGEAEWRAFESVGFEAVQCLFAQICA